MPAPSSPSRPRWFLGHGLELDASRGDTRWDNVVKWWSAELSVRQYDGVIGLSQGSAMAALLLSMLNHPERVPGFTPAKKQDFKFGIFCSGFVSHTSPHAEIYGIPDIPTLHTVDDHDTVVPAARTIELQQMCTNSVVHWHGEGHSVPVGGNFPTLFREFILESAK
ncbi:serine hydrolase-domain-containing protein [Mycena rosella]|uniref:Serine hydrolase-domain-containing protein n=1 Tax=Mycena rosella TaxID=1033263 RepID=A0AAD7DPJ9_MYCRO|nr:serine hydrolase-domain-containing protein [Mycena rosella]